MQLEIQVQLACQEEQEVLVQLVVQDSLVPLDQPESLVAQVFQVELDPQVNLSFHEKSLIHRYYA